MTVFGKKWMAHGVEYWDAMADRCVGLPINDVLLREVRDCKSIIEIGCGAGHLAGWFFANGFSGSYWGCDISLAAATAAGKRVGRAGLVEAGRFEDLSRLGKVPTADLVVARSVVQHQPHWLPLAEAALDHAPRLLFGIIRSIYFKLDGEHEVHDRKTFYDVRISLKRMKQEASEAGMSCDFVHTEGRRGPEVVVVLSRC